MRRARPGFEQPVIPGLIDHRAVEWDRVGRASYLVHQTFRYEYPGPIENLRHRLVVLPPERHGDQRRLLHHLRVAGATAGDPEGRPDAFGNVLVDLHAPVVDGAIEFETWFEVERRSAAAVPVVDGRWLADPRLREFTPLTSPDTRIAAAAAGLAASGLTGLSLAEAAAAWTHGALRYEAGATSVSTTAAEAIALGAGVCQDFTHVMLALCRSAGLPCRYVSGHLLGEGATHAWVEVLLPDPEGPGRAQVWAFDPTNDRRTGLDHLTVAVGRDYRDVAPTAGTYRAPYAGRLSSSKRVDVTGLEYVP